MLSESEEKDVIRCCIRLGTSLCGECVGFGKLEWGQREKKGGVISIAFIDVPVLSDGFGQLSAKGRERWLYWPGEEVCLIEYANPLRILGIQLRHSNHLLILK